MYNQNPFAKDIVLKEKIFRNASILEILSYCMEIAAKNNIYIEAEINNYHVLSRTDFVIDRGDRLDKVLIDIFRRLKVQDDFPINFIDNQ